MKNKIINYSIVIFLVALVFALPTIAQQTACYGQQGGDVQTAASGCEYEFRSGSILDVQAGATVVFDAGMSSNNFLNITAPTAIATGQPALKVNSAGVSNLLEIQDAATPMLTINNGGAVNVTGLTTFNGGSVNNVNAVVAGPTALATATPVLYVNSASAHNLVVISKAATPVFVVGNDGSITGQVIKNTLGLEETCAVQSVTGSATTTPHGLSTPVAVQANLAADPVGEQFVTYTNSAAVITLKVWKSVGDGTPTASGDAVNVAWCAKGTP